MDGAVTKYVLAAETVVRAPASFLPPPIFIPPSATCTAQRPSGLSTASRSLALGQSRLPVEQDRHLIETKTVHAPLAGCFNVPLTGTGDGATTEFGEEHGLLCLERVIPDEVARGLWKLADTAVPFKAEVLRGRSSDGWLDGLVTEPFRAATGTTIVSALSSREHDRREKPRDDGAGLLRAQQSPPLEPALEAVRWLKGDVERIASLFSREVSAVEAPWPGWPRVVAAKRGVGETDVTVKIELLRKGKCPRFHLDRVPLRLICTYVGPGTEWLDGYDRLEMENNKSAPPACNVEISGGGKAHRARAGDVLIFRGQPQGTRGVGVAHRSPDMVQGQRRLVLTMDVGNIIP